MKARLSFPFITAFGLLAFVAGIAFFPGKSSKVEIPASERAVIEVSGKDGAGHSEPTGGVAFELVSEDQAGVPGTVALENSGIVVPARTLAMSPEDQEKLKSRQRFSQLAAKPVSFSKSGLEALFNAKPGDKVELPMNPPLAGTVSHNFLHDTGGRGFGVRLSQYPESQFSVAVEPDGSISGQITQKGNPDAFLVSSSDSSGSVVMEKSKIGNVVCSWENESGKSRIGHLIAPREPEESLVGEIEPGEEYMVPVLESRPGAARVIYLDFDGEVVQGTSWAGGARIDALPYAFPSRIPGIFKAIAEDFAAFNVNVTTVRSSFDNAATGNRCMVIFTPTKDAAPTAGGVAFLNSFGSAVNYMCWAFNAGQQSAGETGSHEVGHQLGLRHDGTSTRTYYSGHTHTPTNVSWGAIMGAAFGIDITHWSKGEYADANNQEEDYDLITDDLPYLADDHGNTTGAASDIPTDISMTYAQTGRIGRRNDADMFRLVLNKSGTITAQVDPTEDTYANLDLVLQIRDAAGNVLATDAPAGPLNASLSLPNLPVGTYFIRVSGGGLGATGFAENGYNNYCSLGNYTLNGSYPFLLIPDPPDGLTATDGTSTDNVFVNWNSTADTDGYRVYRSQVNDPATAIQIADVTSTSLTDITALHNVHYFYWVKAYNLQGDSDFSAGDTGYRRLPLPDTPGSLSATDGASTAYTRVSWPLANFAFEYEVYRNAVNSTSGGTLLATTSSLTYDDTTGTQGVTYYYYVRSVNPEGESGFSDVNSGFRRVPPPATPAGVIATDGTSPTEVVVTWNSVPFAASYYVYRNTINSSSGALSIGGTTGALSYSDTTGIAGSIYFYFVRAVNQYGFSGHSAGDAGFRQAVAPVAPTNVTASQGEFENNIRISWDATADTMEYSIFRARRNSISDAVRIATQAGVIFYDNAADPGRTYYYFVRAINAVGSSLHSAPAIGYVGAEDPTDDRYENNDTLSDAHSIKRGEDEWLSDDDGAGTANDIDWFEVRTGSDAERLDIIVSYEDQSGNFGVKLYDFQRNEVATATEGVGAKVISLSGVSVSKSYYVAVDPGDSEGIPYDIYWASLRAGESGIRIDSRIGHSPVSQVGDGFVNSTAAGQTVSSVSKSRASRFAYFDVKNESAVPEDVKTSGNPGNRFFTTSYWKTVSGVRENVTAEVISGGHISSLLPFEESNFLVYVKAKRALKKHRLGYHYLVITSEAATDPLAMDVNRFHVTKLKERNKKKRRRKASRRR